MSKPLDDKSLFADMSDFGSRLLACFTRGSLIGVYGVRVKGWVGVEEREREAR